MKDGILSLIVLVGLASAASAAERSLVEERQVQPVLMLPQAASEQTDALVEEEFDLYFDAIESEMRLAEQSGRTHAHAC